MVTTERAASFKLNVIAPDLSNLMLMSRFIKTNTTAVWHHQLKNYPEDQTALCMCVLDEIKVAVAFGFGVTLGSVFLLFRISFDKQFLCKKTKYKVLVCLGYAMQSVLKRFLVTIRRVLNT